MKRHGWLGLGMLLGAELSLYAGVAFVATWFTPIMWTGYIVLLDAVIARRTGSSWLTTRRREFGFLATLSVLSWLIFEVYNFKLKNWAYVGLPPEMWLRDVGFFWSFATITPAIFETAELLESFRPASAAASPSHATTEANRPLFHAVCLIFGLACLAIPPALPDSLAPYAFAGVWLGFAAALEPINLIAGQPALLRDWGQGRRAKVWLWLAAGFICGLLWEAWNVQALAHGGAGWLYTMPKLIHDLIFSLHYGQMPLAGLLGFPPFALECFAIYHFLRWALGLEGWLPAPSQSSTDRA